MEYLLLGHPSYECKSKHIKLTISFSVAEFKCDSFLYLHAVCLNLNEKVYNMMFGLFSTA